jgi:hypothetical protein
MSVGARAPVVATVITLLVGSAATDDRKSAREAVKTGAAVALSCDRGKPVRGAQSRRPTRSKDCALRFKRTLNASARP